MNQSFNKKQRWYTEKEFRETTSQEIMKTIGAPSSEPDYTWRDEYDDEYYLFWFEQSVVVIISRNYSNEVHCRCVSFWRVEKTKVRYHCQIVYEKGCETPFSLTSRWAPYYADQICAKIDAGRNKWLATKALEETLK